MEGRFLLDVVIRKSSAVLKLLSGEDKSLLVRGDTFLVLNLSFDILNGVRSLNVQGNSLAGQSLDEDLHSTSTESEDQVKSGLLLNVIVREGSAVLELLASEDESLLIGRDTFLVLDLCLHVLDSVRSLNIEGDGLASEGLDEDLHGTTAESEHEMESGLLLNVVVRKGSAVLELLSSEDESLLIRGDALLVLDLGLDILNGVRGLNVQSDSFTS